MKRAAEAFDVDERGSDSDLVAKLWTARSTSESHFQGVAETHWQFVVTRQSDRTSVVLQGPTPHARVTPAPPDAEFFGVVMRLGSFMPSAPPGGLCAQVLPLDSPRTFWLDGDRWEIPTPENSDVMVERLRRRGLVVTDAGVASALEDRAESLSRRTLQRRVRRATGLTQSVLRQIERAYAAADDLGTGGSVSDVVDAHGFSDQPHLTRSLRRFIGMTPAQLVDTGVHWTASTPLGSLALVGR